MPGVLVFGSGRAVGEMPCGPTSTRDSAIAVTWAPSTAVVPSQRSTRKRGVDGYLADTRHVILLSAKTSPAAAAADENE